MSTERLLEQIECWYEADEHQRIVDTILALPQEERTDELSGQLAVAYNNLDDYETAIEVLEQLRPRQENTDKWQFRMGYALYYLDRNQEAEEAFTHCLALNGDGKYSENCRDYLNRIEDEKIGTVELYTEEQLDAVEAHITKCFGNYSSVFHEMVSPDIHVDICIIPPTPEKNYYTLVTMGMGGHRMNVPDELVDKKLALAELVIALPPDWKIEDNDEVWYWPIRLLKQLARLPGECDTWLGWGHTVDNEEPYAENTQLCGSILLCPLNVTEDTEICPLPDGDEVNFYQVIPIYREEMVYKQSNSADELFERMGKIPFVVQPDRDNVCEDIDTDEDDDDADILVDNDKPSPLAKAMMSYLDCPCQYFPPTLDDDHIFSAYHEAAARGKNEGFVPILVSANDETLWECLIIESNEHNANDDDFAFDSKAVAAYRKAELEAQLPDGEEVTVSLLNMRKEEADEDEFDWEDEILGEMSGGAPHDRFVGYWDYETSATMPLLLVEIPVKNPWEIFAYLPFGGWNDCPDTPELMAVAKYWNQRHGAVPAVITHDVVEFALTTPVQQDQAMQLALEQYAWCPDVVDQCGENETVGILADSLTKSNYWYFWWD